MSQVETRPPQGHIEVRNFALSYETIEGPVEAVGRTEAWEWAVEMVRKGGTVNFFGGCAGGTKVQLDTNRLHYSEITLKATFHHTPETVRRAFGLITAKKIRPTDYITGEAPLSRLQQVLRHMLNRGGDIKTAVEAMKIGAIDFLEKPFDDEVLLASVLSALNQFDQSNKRHAERGEIDSRLAMLSSRERDVLEGLVGGLANKQIAYNLGISPRTVEIYRANLMTKMQAASLSDLVRMALVAGILGASSDNNKVS